MFARDAVNAVALDMSTLFVVATCVTALLGLLLLFAWTQERIRALAWWGGAYLIGGFSVALWILEPTYVPRAMPSAMLFLACGMIWSAARLFHGRPVIWPAMITGAVAWLAACTFPPFMQDGSLRALLASTIISAYVFLAAAELWRERRKALIRRWPALFVPVLHGAVFLFPLPIAALLPEERGVVSLAGGWISVFVLESLLYVVGTAFILLVLTKERVLRMHKAAALIDPMTGLLNRRGFVEGAAEIRAALKGSRQGASVLLFDLDHFKKINDRFGHAVGDETLKLFASAISSRLRENDLVARLGGEEFVAVIPGAIDDGLGVAERLRAGFEMEARAVAGRFIGATVSIGVAWGDATSDINLVLERADHALYAAKAAGRNRVVAAGSEWDLVPAPSPVPDLGAGHPRESAAAFRTPCGRPWLPGRQQAAA